MADELAGQAKVSGLLLHRLRPDDEAVFSELAGIYQQVFPDSERKPLDLLRCMLAASDYHFLVAMKDEILAGLAIVRVLSCRTAALLEYMAIAPDYRGRGFGAQIVASVARTFSSPTAALLLEVESDRVESAELDLRTRRKQFYHRLGARELSGLRWMMPPVAATLPPAMEMMAFLDAEDSVSRDRLRGWLQKIYVEVYGQRPDDPRIGAMLASLEEEIRLI